jgi:hypothetical protein
MKANRKSSKKETTIPIVEAPEVKHAPLGADEFGTPILPTLTHTVEPAPATEPATVTVETTVPVIEKKAKKAKAVKPAPVAPVSELRVTDSCCPSGSTPFNSSRTNSAVGIPVHAPIAIQSLWGGVIERAYQLIDGKDFGRPPPTLLAE